MIEENAIKAALTSVKYPGFTRDIVSFGLVREVIVEEPKVIVHLSITTADASVPDQLRSAITSALGSVPGVSEVEVAIETHAPKHQPPRSPQARSGKIEGVRRIITVASGKGGVGKSTLSANLACAFTKLIGKSGRVGLLDCDIHGPSIPLMMGVADRPELENDKILPLSNFGVKVMSMGLLIDEDSPVVWRGPMITNAIVQFLQTINWGELDLLLVDLPPGTGDAHLSLMQSTTVDGAVVVTTPQTAAVNVARRGAALFEKVNVPVLGVIENMSYLPAPDGSRQYLFGRDGGRKTADALKVDLLGQIPLSQEIREGGDAGVPVVVAFPEHPASTEIMAIAERIWKNLERTC